MHSSSSFDELVEYGTRSGALIHRRLLLARRSYCGTSKYVPVWCITTLLNILVEPYYISEDRTVLKALTACVNT